MSIDGTYAFVYGGVNGLGRGLFTVAGEKFYGVDYVGGLYIGTARENDDGTISIAIDFDVKSGQDTAPQELPHRRHIEHTMPPRFGDGRAIAILSPPSSLTVMVKQVSDDYAQTRYIGALHSFALKFAKALAHAARFCGAKSSSF